MILSLPFWLLSICISLFAEKPKAHPHIAQAEQASAKDLKSLTAENLPVQSRNPANESGTPTL
jgi:hypothetical protein